MYCVTLKRKDGRMDAGERGRYGWYGYWTTHDQYPISIHTYRTAQHCLACLPTDSALPRDGLGIHMPLVIRVIRRGWQTVSGGLVAEPWDCAEQDALEHKHSRHCSRSQQLAGRIRLLESWGNRDGRQRVICNPTKQHLCHVTVSVMLGGGGNGRLAGTAPRVLTSLPP